MLGPPKNRNVDEVWPENTAATVGQKPEAWRTLCAKLRHLIHTFAMPSQLDVAGQGKKLLEPYPSGKATNTTNC